MSFENTSTPSGLKIGYARVSTRDQNLDLQTEALKAIGCTRIFDDTISGAKRDRPGLERALEHLRAGDTLVVWKLDRLGRSVKDLVELVSGRKRAMTDSKLEAAKKLIASGVAPREVAANLGISVPTLYRWIPASERP